MSYFKGEYLRVLTPVTADGNTLEYYEDGQVKYKESHLPTSARKSMEKENLNRAKHLQHKIELVGSFDTAPAAPAAPKRGRKPNQS